ncbi:unnamed protein product [Parnassius apollo]|uniref:(apollo) hypothetical protein n=1 Tax=Parnassius apollo TaxID=110799 RepID=A0A8S3X479_PARAO|nr:unnamed protein product [Parnassius apollo]
MAEFVEEQSPALTHISYVMKVSSIYNVEYPQNATSLLKTSKNHPTLLQRLACIHEIKQKKKNDVEKIFEKQFGSNWVENSELQWFKTNIFNVPEPNNDDQGDSDDENNEDDDELCDCYEPDTQEFI